MTAKPPLRKEEFRRIERARYSFTCHLCGNDYPANTPVYWRRHIDANKVAETTTVCPQCFKEA